MRDEPFALSTRPPTPSADTDYDAICAAVTATARGRWFLDEFARRNRNTDTTQVLDAIARMQATVSSDRAQQSAQQATQEVRIELLEMARTIALTRAEVAEHQSETARAAVAEPTGAASPEIAAAAERLLQIAWTMRACGVELAASDQIGQIAQAILSADTLRNLGDHRAHKLTEALHHLEQRIDMMLDGHRPGPSDTLGEKQPQAALLGRQAEREPTAPDAAAIGAAIFAAAAAVEAETEPAAAPANDDIPAAAVVDAVPPAPEPEMLAAVPALDQEAPQDREAPEAEAQAEPAEPEPAEAIASAATHWAPDESAQAFALGEPQAPALEETARAALPAQAEPTAAGEFALAPSTDEAAEHTAPSVSLDATEFPMDDDVVLSVADDDVEHAPLPSLELGPGTVETPQQPTPLPTTDMAPALFSTPAPDAAAVAVHAALEPAAALPLTHDLPAIRGEHAEFAVEPFAADNIVAQTVFAGLDLEPLVIVPEPATEARSPAQTIEPEADVPAASITIDDVLNRQGDAAPPTSDRPPAYAARVPIPEPGLSADDDLLVAPGIAATALSGRPAFDSSEHAQVAEAAGKAQPIALELDPIAVQVDHDLDSLTDIVPNDLVPGGGARTDATATSAPTVRAASTIQDDPADFLLEALPAPISVARDVVPPAAKRQPPTAEFTTALAAIEIELRAGVTVPGAETQASGTALRGADAALASESSTADSTLAALMAMSEEERIALFS